MPEFMSISWRIGPLTTTIAEAELDVEPRADTCEAASARMTGKYSGRAPGHHGVHRHLLDRVFPGHAKFGRLHAADDLVRLAAGLRQHRGDALLGRQDDRQPVGPVVLEKLLLQVVFGVGLDQPRRRALECAHAQPFSTVVRPAMISCITGRPVTGSLP